MPEMNQRNGPPPAWADKLLARLCPPDLLEEMQGDLHERYQERVQLLGVQAARRQYWRDVLGFARPYFLKRKPNPHPKPLYTDMLRNHFITTLRLFRKQKGYALLNLSGLALGLTTSLLILLWVRDELSYDQYHEKLDRLCYAWHNVDSTKGWIVSDTQGPLAPAMLAEVPEVANATRLTFGRDLQLTVGEKRFKENGRYADPALFEMFSYPLAAGNPRTVLRDLSSIVISDSLAYKYFGGIEQALGKTVRVENNDNYTVSAVFRTIPRNSSERFDFVLPFEAIYKTDAGLRDWGNSSLITFVELKENASMAVVDGKIKNYIKRNVKDARSTLFLQPLADLHLYDPVPGGKHAGGRISYVRLFGAVAAFILLIACINFMNLATARSVQRAKEVGVRKSVGAGRGSLIAQFMTESVGLSVVAAGLALLLAQLLLPWFNGITDKHLALPFATPGFWGLLGGITLLTGLVAGSYPALLLSSFKPVEVLKGTLRTGSGAAHLRQGLVVFQFVLSTVMIVATVVVYRQVQYIRNTDIGLQRENLVYLPAGPGISGHYEPYRNQLRNEPGVAGVSRSNYRPISVYNTTGDADWDGKQPDELISFQILKVDHDYAAVTGLTLLQGRDFSRKFVTDSLRFIINEEAARLMGLQHPVGQRLKLWDREGSIIGVVKDFHSRTMHGPQQPLIMTLDPEDCGLLMVRTQPGKTAEVLAALEQLHRQYAPEDVFEYKFMDQAFEQLYQSDVMRGKLASGFAFIAVFISCLGLFGLAAFTAEKRTKEIGIRKVLGANVAGIVALLSRSFLKPVLLAILIASPLAWYLMNQWLENFAQKTPIDWGVFALAGGAALLVALFTVSFQSIRAALANPVKSLRSE
ncbi:MAG: Acidobacterial duplicated orphan permease (function unknown) [uncultured Cytophagales bacterium]|uniref:ABC transporter, permease protein n=1 Tax=uncultured Cytophagales bacterium TaxID=158755 RepID=A0A6J4HWU0_9SPHI|nr:MAG: Acidobacterial duplicated orphan permease (function unknown) [uncultured Cytophagales bacterium]